MKVILSLLVGMLAVASTNASAAAAVYKDRGAQPFAGGAVNGIFNFPAPEFVGAVRFRIPPDCPMNVTSSFISARTGMNTGGLGPVTTLDHGYTVFQYNVGETGDGALLSSIQVMMVSSVGLANCGVRLFTSPTPDDGTGGGGSNPNPL